MKRFKDIKPDKDHNAVQNLMCEVYRQMFPSGTSEEYELDKKLCDLLDNKYPMNKIVSVLRYTLASLLISDNTLENVAKAITLRTDVSFSYEDAIIVCNFAIDNNTCVALLVENTEVKMSERNQGQM